MDIKKADDIKKILFAMRYKLLVLGIFFLLSFISLFFVQSLLIEKTHLYGSQMANSYTIEQEKNYRAYTVALQFAGEELTHIISRRNTANTNIYDVLKTLQSLFNNSRILPYAIVHEQVFFIDPEHEAMAQAINIKDIDWYDHTINAKGEVVCTNAYKSRLTGEYVITFAKQINNQNIIIAFDILAKEFKDLDNAGILPENSHYYLSDEEGNLLYTTDKREDLTTLKQQIKNTVARLHDITPQQINLFENDTEKYVIYYNVSSNGWISFISVPQSYLVKDVYRIGIGAFIFLVIFLIITIYTTYREVKLNQNIDRNTETIRVLGNQYYAIYRIDFINNTYEMIKDTQMNLKKIPPRGKLENFIKNISQAIEDNAKQDFIDNFSAENIKKLVAQRIHDYGGDFKKKTSSENYQWVSVRLLFDESLNSNEAVLCFRSIDEEKQAQLQQLDLLKTSLENAQQSEQARNMFFSSMSHDMRTPLNAIIGLANLANNHINEPEKIEEYLNKISISSKHLLDLINDILEISRLEQGKMNVDKKQINLKTCIEESTVLFQSKASQEGKIFIVDLDIQDYMVFSDPFRLNQILNNLLSNAFKFTKEGDKITLRAKQLGQDNYTKYQFEIIDTGIGMSQQFLEKLFIPYERETRFSTKNIQGTGLGTAIVKNIISHLGGEIHVSSELGKGTTFTVTLPFETVKQPAENKKEHSPAQEKSLKGKRVLIAEDNAINMEIAAELLSVCEMEVTKAWDGQEAYTIYKNASPNYFDIILLDMQMPVMGGCEAAKAIRQLERADARTIPIIAVTANAFAEDYAATAAAGMNAHVSKPLDFALLCKTMLDLLP